MSHMAGWLSRGYGWYGFCVAYPIYEKIGLVYASPTSVITLKNKQISITLGEVDLFVGFLACEEANAFTFCLGLIA